VRVRCWRFVPLPTQRPVTVGKGSGCGYERLYISPIFTQLQAILCGSFPLIFGYCVQDRVGLFRSARDLQWGLPHIVVVVVFGSAGCLSFIFIIFLPISCSLVEAQEHIPQDNNDSNPMQIGQRLLHPSAYLGAPILSYLYSVIICTTGP
jgi:hypothetical protein